MNDDEMLDVAFFDAEIQTEGLRDLVLSVLRQIAKTVDFDEEPLGYLYERPTLAGYEGEVDQDRNVTLNGAALARLPWEVARALVAHEFAHSYLGHWRLPTSGLAEEHEADECAREWGFDVEAFRRHCGLATEQ